MIHGKRCHRESVLLEDHLTNFGAIRESEGVGDASVAGRRHRGFAMVRDPIAFVETVGVVETLHHRSVTLIWGLHDMVSPVRVAEYVWETALEELGGSGHILDCAVREPLFAA